MSRSAGSVGSDLPSLWKRRLTEEVQAAEGQVITCAHRVGDGLERLVARWAAEGRMTALRPRDVRDAEALTRAMDAAREAAGPTESGWYVAVLRSVEVPSLRSQLRPGDRLLLLIEAAQQAEEADDSGGALDPCLQGREVVDWAQERWQIELDRAAADAILQQSEGLLRGVEVRLAEMAVRQERTASGRGRGLTSGPQSATPGGSSPPEIALELLGVPRFRLIRSATASREYVELRWGYRGVLEVVSALAVAPEMQLPGRDLLERLWPKLDIDDARKRFYPAISHARRLFSECAPSNGTAIESDGGVYRLNPEWTWICDVVRLREAVARSRHVSDDLMQVEIRRDAAAPTDSDDDLGLQSVLETAWASYRGPFLETLRSAWVRDEREEQRRNYLVILRRLAAIRHVQPEAVGLEDVLRTILVADPVAEDAHVALMRLYAERGRADLVRRQYDRMCGVLMDDLGLQPMDRTVREVERLVAS